VPSLRASKLVTPGSAAQPGRHVPVSNVRRIGLFFSDAILWKKMFIVVTLHSGVSCLETHRANFPMDHSGTIA
jgi:hypothetical protein